MAAAKRRDSAGCPSRGYCPKHSMPQSPTTIAEALAELEAYDDEEHHAVLELVRDFMRDLLDEQDSGDST